MLRVLERSGRGFLFGGVVRDIAVAGISEFGSDIDIVVAGDGDELQGIVNEFGSTHNRFGGHRIMTAHWSVDFWRAADTWAIREGIVAYRNVRSLLETTAFNWDSILYQLKDGQVICGPSYFEDLGRRYLDVVLERNPNPLGMSTRIFRTIARHDDLELSGSTVQTMRRIFGKYTYEEIQMYEMEHYQRSSVREAMYGALRDRVLGNGPGSMRWSGQMCLFEQE